MAYCQQNFGDQFSITLVCRRPEKPTSVKELTVNVLFICSRNQWRSRTAEAIFKNDQRHSVKSAGTENEARIRVTEKLVTWADLIFVMEKKHRDRLREKFGSLAAEKEIVILEIQDDYKYMDAELIEILMTSVSPYLKL